jgi:cis-3-alkyl-4-acyloxetan-2-one decarboxylase
MGEYSVVEFGTQRGENLFFLGGFPDDGLSGWSPLFEILKQKYNIISLCLPQYSKGCQYKRWGYSFDELVALLEITINQLSPEVPITFICHDWGAVIGLLFAQKFPQRVSRLILVDVGIRDHGIKNIHQIWEIVLILLYQWWFCSAYIISQFFGAPLGNCIFVLYMMLVTLFPFLKVCPTDTFHRPASEMTVEMCFIYFQYWKMIFQGHPIVLQMPSCPVLYLVSLSPPLLSSDDISPFLSLQYGTKKNAMFHGKDFLAKLGADKRSRSRSFDCGHYPMHSFPQEMAQEIETFFQDT